MTSAWPDPTHHSLNILQWSKLIIFSSGFVSFDQRSGIAWQFCDTTQDKSGSDLVAGRLSAASPYKCRLQAIHAAPRAQSDVQRAQSDVQCAQSIVQCAQSGVLYCERTAGHPWCPTCTI